MGPVADVLLVNGAVQEAKQVFPDSDGNALALRHGFLKGVNKVIYASIILYHIMAYFANSGWGGEKNNVKGS